MRLFKLVYVLGTLVSIVVLCVAFSLFVYTAQFMPPKIETVMQQVLVTQEVWVIITATPQSTEIVQFAPYQPPTPETYPSPEPYPMPTLHPTPTKCKDQAMILSQEKPRLLTTNAVVFKSVITNSGNCTWSGYKLVALNVPVDIPMDQMYPGNIADIEFAIANPPPGSFAVDLVLLDQTGNLLLFEQADGGLLHFQVVVPVRAQPRFRVYPGGGGGKGIFCFGGS